MLTPAEADALIARHLAPFPTETRPLAQCAGAVLRAPVRAERDAPPFDRVTMDGIALSAVAAGAGVEGGRRSFAIQSSQPAGAPAHRLEAPDRCIEVMTGAVLPHGCDAVIPIEDLEVADGVATLAADVHVVAGQNVHRRGSDGLEGEVLLEAGTRLAGPEVAIVASAGLATVEVSAEPTIAVVSTGTELVEPGQPIEPHQVRRSNVHGVVAALRRHGYTQVVDAHVVDCVEALRRRLRLHIETHDVLILSGGVSMGRLDLVPHVLAELGAHTIFHRIAQRPGKPFWFGTAPTGCAIFALPGNPVSTLVCLARYVMPALRAASGEAPRRQERAALAAPLRPLASLASFVPVRLHVDDAGCLRAEPRPTRGSGDFLSLAGTDGFVEVPPGHAPLERDRVLSFWRW